jgi:Zn-dependent alcohol dehydrogenase
VQVIISYKHVLFNLMVQRINLDHYITHKLPFSKIQEAFDLLNKGGCIRCVMDYEN